MTDWRDRAACLDHDPELFWPYPTDHDGINKAKAVCHACPVRAECWTAHRDEPDGIYAATTPDERAQARRRTRTPLPELDLIAIERRANGEDVPLTRPEKEHLARRLLTEGHSHTHTSKVAGLRPVVVAAIARALQAAA